MAIFVDSDTRLSLRKKFADFQQGPAVPKKVKPCSYEDLLACAREGNPEKPWTKAENAHLVRRPRQVKQKEKEQKKRKQSNQSKRMTELRKKEKEGKIDREGKKVLETERERVRLYNEAQRTMKRAGNVKTSYRLRV